MTPLQNGTGARRFRLMRDDLIRKLRRSHSDRQIADGIKASGEWRRKAQPDPEVGERLRQLIEPFLELGNDRRTFELLAMFAVNAWNTALMPLADRTAFTDKVLWLFPKDSRDHIRSITEAMCYVKRRLFGDDRRYIADCEIVETETGFALAAKVLPHDPALESPEVDS